MQAIKNENTSLDSKITIYTFENQTFRIVGTLEKPQFVVKDICNILEIVNVTNAVKNIPKEWKGDFHSIKDSSGHKQQMLTVSALL